MSVASGSGQGPSEPPGENFETIVDNNNDNHIYNLSRVCRVCGNTLLAGSAYAYPVKGWEARLTQTFGNIFD